MLIKKAILFFLLLSFIPSWSTMNGQQIFSTSYSMDQGLASNRVYALVQDSCGYMWFGTDDGLCRFDGISFHNYFLSEYLTSTTSNSIRKLYIDRDGLMWIGLDNGVVIFNPTNNSFRPFHQKTIEGESIQAYITDIIQDSDGEMWIATMDKGLYRYSKTKNLLRVYKAEAENNGGLLQNRIITLLEDSKKRIWIGSYSEGLNCYDKQTDLFMAYRKENKAGSISENFIQKLFEDSHGNLWVGTFQKGLDLFDPITQTFTNYNDKSTNNLLYHIHDIIEQSPGVLYIASDNGVGLFNVMSKEVVLPDNLHLGIMTDRKFVYSMYIDRERGLWLGTYFDGVEYYSSFQRNFEYYSCTSPAKKQAGRVVNVIREDENNLFWIGTDDNGIFQYNTLTHQIKPFRTASDIGSTYYCIHDILRDGNKLYVATYERGLEVFDLKSGNKKTYLHEPSNKSSIPSSRVFSLFKASNGRIYVGTADGACFFEPSEQKFVRVASSLGRIASITEDHNGIIWIASSVNGLNSYNIKTGEKKVYTHSESATSLTKNALTSLTIDNNKQLWVGTYGQGFCRYNETTDDFVRYEHLKLPNKIISAILPVGDDLWISTKKGLVVFNPIKNTFKAYSKSNGLINEQFTSKSLILSRDGLIFLGSNNGFCHFNPQNLRKNSYNPPVILTSMTIFGKDVRVGAPDSPLSEGLERTKRIVLSHKQSMIGFKFAALSYVAPNENMYEYILDGHDNKWQSSKGANNYLTYSSLPPGNYTLRVRATNNDEVWSTNEVKLNIVVQPPFYKSKWAYFCYLILALVAAFFFVRYYEKQRSRIQMEHIKLINDQKEKELYDSKIEFFTNIAHEIRTPLSLIIGPIEYLIKNIGNNSTFIEYLTIVEHNHKRLFSLVNQLLDFRKVDSGAYHLSYNVYPVKELIHNSIAIFQLTAEQRKIHINTTSIADDLTIVTDEEAITKVISNLVSNALKYAQHEINITAFADEKGTIIKVSDDGLGINDNEKLRIFDAFYQVKNDKGTNKLGVGIGLHLSMSLVKLMNGDITVEDNEESGSGTTIVIELPQNEYVQINDLASALAENFIMNKETTELMITEEKPSETKQHMVLIIDDNPEILHFLAKVLSANYFVISALSGEQGIEILENNKIDLIVSDVVMGGMSGFEVCKNVKTNIHTSHIPVVLLTAKSDTQSKIEGLDSGADAYIEKPFSPMQLNAQLQNLIKRREKQQNMYATTPLSEVYNVYTNKLDQEFIDKCCDIFNHNIADTEFSISQLAQDLNLSRTAVFSKIKGLTGMTPNDFLKVYRLQRACRLMVEAKYKITEIVFLTGFNSSSYFAKCFQKQFGINPTEYVKSIKTESKMTNIEKKKMNEESEE